jgi:hypothetical protein
MIEWTKSCVIKRHYRFCILSGFVEGIGRMENETIARENRAETDTGVLLIFLLCERKEGWTERTEVLAERNRKLGYFYYSLAWLIKALLSRFKKRIVGEWMANCV